jgi:hypothetical protein
MLTEDELVLLLEEFKAEGMEIFSKGGTFFCLLADWHGTHLI